MVFMWCLAEVEEMKKELEEQLRQNEEEMNAMKKSWEQRLKEVQTAQEVRCPPSCYIKVALKG